MGSVWCKEEVFPAGCSDVARCTESVQGICSTQTAAASGPVRPRDDQQVHQVRRTPVYISPSMPYVFVSSRIHHNHFVICMCLLLYKYIIPLVHWSTVEYTYTGD